VAEEQDRKSASEFILVVALGDLICLAVVCERQAQYASQNSQLMKVQFLDFSLPHRGAESAKKFLKMMKG
jgi:hypothetical protein